MYFNERGKANTAQTIDIALQAAAERGIDNIVVASNTGETALLLESFSGNIVCVTHVDGFREPGKNELTQQMRDRLEVRGMKVLTAAHALSGAERALSTKFGGVYPVEIIAHTLRMMGQGTKVCVEIGAMALDAGLIPYDQPVIAVCGSGRGADTALILTPAYTSNILSTRIHEVLCKPYNP